MVRAVNRHNFNIPEIQKNTTIYHSVFDTSIISHFGDGLKDKISSVVLGQAEAPNTTQVEAKQAKIGYPGSSTLAMHAEEQDFDPVTDLTARFDELLASIGWKRRKPYDKTKAKCYNYDKVGHFWHEFQEPQQPGTSGGDDKGPKRPRSGGPPRSQNAVDDRPELGQEEEEEENDEESEAGNY